jgi:hypothetical protein
MSDEIDLVKTIGNIKLWWVVKEIAKELDLPFSISEEMEIGKKLAEAGRKFGILPIRVKVIGEKYDSVFAHHILIVNLVFPILSKLNKIENLCQCSHRQHIEKLFKPPVVPVATVAPVAAVAPDSSINYCLNMRPVKIKESDVVLEVRICAEEFLGESEKAYLISIPIRIFDPIYYNTKDDKVDMWFPKSLTVLKKDVEKSTGFILGLSKLIIDLKKKELKERL